jgi:hypothetical protein
MLENSRGIPGLVTKRLASLLVHKPGATALNNTWDYIVNFNAPIATIMITFLVIDQNSFLPVQSGWW